MGYKIWLVTSVAGSEPSKFAMLVK